MVEQSSRDVQEASLDMVKHGKTLQEQGIYGTSQTLDDLDDIMIYDH